MSPEHVSSYLPYIHPERRRARCLLLVAAVLSGAAAGFYPYRAELDTRSYCLALNGGKEVITDLDNDGVEEGYCMSENIAEARRITMQEVANWQYSNWLPVKGVREDENSGRAYGKLDYFIQLYLLGNNDVLK